jgi:hypothetical protein
MKLIRWNFSRFFMESSLSNPKKSECSVKTAMRWAVQDSHEK